MSNEDIDFIIEEITSKWKEINPKDQKKLKNLIEKLQAVKNGKEFNIS